MKRWPWAREEAANIIKAANEWLEKTDEWFVEQLPEKGACFAYGFSGCPICSATCGIWGKARCSWDKPGKVTCLNGHLLPDADHPDDGTGFKGKDGRLHYFVGIYNAWVIETLQSKACRNLALAYSLTGDERYAHKAAVILDAFARIYPDCTSGSWDYPSKPPSGRFARPWYQVARTLVLDVDHYDRIFHTKSLDEPSLVAGLTRRQNIEKNLLKNGAQYCYEQSQKGSLNNGEADYVRGVLAVGCVLGIPDYVAWALDGPYGIRSYLANNVDRDGRYFETSSSYSIHTHALYESYSEPLLNWIKPVNLYEDPKLKAFFTLPVLAGSCLGHMVPYGDTSPDIAVRYDTGYRFVADDYHFAEVLYARAVTAADKKAFGSLVNYLANGNVEAARAMGRKEDKEWLLFHAEEPPSDKAKLSPDLERRVRRTDFFGQEGKALLRTERGPDAQGLVLRYGQSLNHGHLDDLNINYYALGRELTYDLGYGIGSTHTQMGWARTTTSHNLVVVNEQLQRGGPRAASGGSLRLIADTQLAQVVEAESANSYGHEGVSEYRRLCAIVGEGRERYLLDVFRVTGGRQHDYLFHGSTTNTIFTGVDLGPIEKGSLAGPEFEWGNLQLNDGDMRGHPGKPYWNPPPGNGYGFLVSPRRAHTDNSWTATWQLDGQAAMRLHVLGSPGTEVISAKAPGVYPYLPKAGFAIARRRGENLASTFVSVLEPFKLPTNALVELGQTGAFIDSVDSTATGVRVHLRNGSVDVIDFKEGFALRRVKGTNVLGACRVVPKAERGRVLAVDYERRTVTIDSVLPKEKDFVGQVIYFDNPAYTRNTPYPIAAVQRMGNKTRISLGDKTLFLGRGQVSSAPSNRNTLTTVIPHEYAKAKQQVNPNGFFAGKLLRSADGRKTAQVKDVVIGRSFQVKVDDSGSFQQGDDFYYCDVQAGDEFAVQLVVEEE